jgi:two-component system LytT family response regulator
MRILIVDDEAPARARLRQIVATQQGFEVAGEASTGPEAMKMVAELKPDLLLLDIQMPGCSGIDVAASLPKPRPLIIFCTAHDQHAIDAFELHAIDYLLKPISRVRLTEALQRVKAQGDTMHIGPTRFLARNASQYLVVSEAKVLYFSSEDGLTRLIAEGGQYWMDPTLNELELRLDRSRFFRISRASLVNLNAVERVIPLPGGAGEVLLKNGTRLEVSRRRFNDLLRFMVN